MVGFCQCCSWTNSLIATDLAFKHADYVVTEDGFGSDLGMPKDLDVISPLAELHPSLICMVTTIRALKLHVGMKFDELDKENVETVKEGSKNIIKHLKNDRLYDIPVIVSINKFKSDTTNEIKALESILKEEGFKYALNTSYVDRPKGGKDLAAIALDEIDMNNKIDFKPLVNKKMILEEKIFVIANKIYGAGKVEYSSRAKKELEEYSAKEYADYDVVISKIPTSLSDDPKLLNVPENFTLHIDSFRLFTEAKFIVPFTGEIFTMPGLPKVPAAKHMESTHK